VTDDGVDVEMDFNRLYDVTLHAVRDTEGERFRQIVVYPGASSLLGVGVSADLKTKD